MSYWRPGSPFLSLFKLGEQREKSYILQFFFLSFVMFLGTVYIKRWWKLLSICGLWWCWFKVKLFNQFTLFDCNLKMLFLEQFHNKFAMTLPLWSTMYHSFRWLCLITSVLTEHEIYNHIHKFGPIAVSH